MRLDDDHHIVLVVEDDPNHAMLINLAFAHRDPHAHVRVTESAELAIAYLLGAQPDTESESVARPDVIVLDIGMPGMGGIGFLEWYRQQGDWIRDIPVIVFTSSDDPELLRECFALGAREFKQKSSDFGELVEVVKRVLQRSPQKKGDGGGPA